MTFFALQTPRDILDKANREYTRLCESWTIDNVFNFFVTANHIFDYLTKSKGLDPQVIREFRKNPVIKLSRDVCDKGKHMTLTQRPDPQTEIVETEWSDEDLWILVSGRHQVSVRMLAKNTIDTWNSFFERHGI